MAGWYPDPGSRTRLRWWDGEDWTDIRRAPPSEAELINYEENHRFYAENDFTSAGRQQIEGFTRNDAQQIIAEVRNVARAEVDRAAEQFSQRATAAARSFTPLISEYTSKLVRWVKLAVIVAIILLVAWFLFQVVAQASLFEWIGDRIDNIGNNQNGAPSAVMSVRLL
jgi:hypothetical protein